MAVAPLEIVTAIKGKRELSTLDDAYVRDRIQKILKKERRISEKIAQSKSFKEFSRSAEFKALKSLVREELRKVYGVFQKEKKKGERGKNENASPEEKLLSHRSSAERYAYYEEIYKKLFSITGKPTTLLDLGCGANPYSYAMLGCTPYYVAVDLPSSDLQEIADFFRKRKIEGEVLGVDLVNNYAKVGLLLESNHFDVAFLFKLLDSLETVKRNISGKLLDAVNATWLVVSFPTVSIGGKKHIKKERRAWFEKLLARKGWYYEELSVGNEVFYLVLKDPIALSKRYYAANAKDLTAKYVTDMTPEADIFGKFLKTGKVLDMGCGPGRDTRMLRLRGYDMTGIDQNAQFLRVAKRRNQGVRFVEGDFRMLPFKDGEFDGVWSMASIVHLYDDDLKRVLEEYRRVLKRGGKLLVTGKEGKSRLNERHGAQVFFRHDTKEELERFITDAGFTVLHAEIRPKRTKIHEQLDFVYIIAEKK